MFKGTYVRKVKIIVNKLRFLERCTDTDPYICNKENNSSISPSSTLYYKFCATIRWYINFISLHKLRKKHKIRSKNITWHSGRCILLPTRKMIWNLLSKLRQTCLKALSWLLFLFWIYPGFSRSLSKWIKQVLAYKVNILDVPKNHIRHILPVASRPLSYLQRETPQVEGLGCQQAVYFGF